MENTGLRLSAKLLMTCQKAGDVLDKRWVRKIAVKTNEYISDKKHQLSQGADKLINIHLPNFILVVW